MIGGSLGGCRMYYVYIDALLRPNTSVASSVIRRTNIIKKN